MKVPRLEKSRIRVTENNSDLYIQGEENGLLLLWFWPFASIRLSRKPRAPQERLSSSEVLRCLTVWVERPGGRRKQEQRPSPLCFAYCPALSQDWQEQNPQIHPQLPSHLPCTQQVWREGPDTSTKESLRLQSGPCPPQIWQGPSRAELLTGMLTAAGPPFCIRLSSLLLLY